MMGDFTQILEKLRNGELKSIEISKDQYLQFREHLIKDAQFKHFRGVAKQGGSVIYTFLEQPRT